MKIHQLLVESKTADTLRAKAVESGALTDHPDGNEFFRERGWKYESHQVILIPSLGGCQRGKARAALLTFTPEEWTRVNRLLKSMRETPAKAATEEAK